MEIRVTLTQYNAASYLIGTVKVNVLAGCEYTTLMPFDLATQHFSILLNGTTSKTPINIPKDTFSLKLGDQDGYAYCKERLLFARFNGEDAFEVTSKSETL